jgi:transcriptional repressor of cell division inhibition gene dicB
MRKVDVLAHFKTGRAVAAALKIRESSVSQWPDIIPIRRAYELERITGGALKATPDVIPKEAA